MLTGRYSYDAWGKLTSITDPDGNPITDASHIAIINPYRYRGYYYDTEIGMYYLQSRYYDAEVGRFVNGDEAEIVLYSYSNVKGIGLYAYCNNSPVDEVDPWGHFSIPAWTLSMAIDGIILWIAGLINATWLSITAPLKALAKREALKVFQRVVVPAVKSVIGKIIQVAVKAFIRLGKKALAASINIAVTQTLGILLSNGARFLSACLSLGGFIAAIVDIGTDKKFDGGIKLW